MNVYNRQRELRRYWIGLAVGLSVILCLEWNSVNLSALFDKDGAANAAQLMRGLLSPNVSPDFLLRILHLSIESLFVGIVGTAFAVILGMGLALFAIRLPSLPDPPDRTPIVIGFVASFIRWFARFLLGFFRSIPEVVWAYLFVQLLGLGPGAAVLAITLTVGGSIGKLFAELGEAADRQVVGSLKASGASRWAILLFAVIPQVSRQWVAYALFRMECNIRTGTILGVVGAGGLGSEIVLSIRYMEFDKLATALLAVLVFVIVLERLSAVLRRRPARWALAFATVGTAAGLYFLNIPWLEMLSGNIWLSYPDNFSLSSDFLQRTLILTFDTLTMAWVATVVAALLAFFLAPLSTPQLTTHSYLQDTYRKTGVARIVARLLLWMSRYSLQVSRAMPELTLALIFVVWVGPGAYAGILAIAFHNIGVLGRLYTDVYEEVEPGPARALQSGGTGSFGVWLFAVLPQVVPRLLTFTLYRFEVNVRATAMVGFVGAGGIGDALHTAISLFQLADLTALLMVMLAVVTAVDSIGDRLRHRILVGHSESHQKNSLWRALRRMITKSHSQPDTEATVHLSSPQRELLVYRIGSTCELSQGRVLTVTNDTILVECDKQCPCTLILDVFVASADLKHHEIAHVLVRDHAGADLSEYKAHEKMLLTLIAPSQSFLAALHQHATSVGADIQHVDHSKYYNPALSAKKQTAVQFHSQPIE